MTFLPLQKSLAQLSYINWVKFWTTNAFLLRKRRKFNCESYTDIILTL